MPVIMVSSQRAHISHPYKTCGKINEIYCVTRHPNLACFTCCTCSEFRSCPLHSIILTWSDNFILGIVLIFTLFLSHLSTILINKAHSLFSLSTQLIPII
jgi:hypothetical protein